MARFKASTTNNARAFEEFAELASAPERARELPRTYGFEIEAPALENLARAIRRSADQMPDDLGTWKEDSSVESEDEFECECGCGECTYHECDCEHCEYTNTDPDHCGDAEYCRGTGEFQEFASIVQTNTHGEVLTALEMASAEEVIHPNSSCGFHVHIGSGDLTIPQLVSVQVAFRAIRTDLLKAIYGRGYCYYAQELTDDELANSRRGKPGTRYLAVNLCRAMNPHLSEDERTIEIRLGAGTASTALIRARVIVSVAIVEYARKGNAPYWLARCESVESLLAELGITL